MKFGLETVRRVMSTATNRQISAKAAFLLAQKLEEYAIEITKKAETLLEQRNKERASRNVELKSKITDELISTVINDFLKGVP